MADQQQDQKEKQNALPDIKDTAEGKDEKEAAIKHEGIKERTGQRLEVLEESDLYKPDTETTGQIEAINPDEQKEKKETETQLTLLGAVTTTILAKIQDFGIKAEEFDTPDKFNTLLAKIDIDSKYAELKSKLSNLTEKETLQKLREVLDTKTSFIYSKLSEKWSDFITKSKILYDDAKKGTASKAIDWVTKNPGKVVLIVGGAFVLWKIFFSEKERNGEKGESWTDNIFAKTTGLALGALTIGALIGPDKIADWFKEHFSGDLKDMALHGAEQAKEAGINWLNKTLHFDEMKNRLLKFMPNAPEWLKGSKFKDILTDMGIDPTKSDTWGKYGGAGGAALLLRDWVTRKHKTDTFVKGVLEKFLGHEKADSPETETSPDKKAELEKEYGEFVPIKEAWKNYYNEVQKALLPIEKYINDNPEVVTMGGLFLASFEKVRSAFLKGAKMGFEGFKGLASLPFKAVKNFPVTSIFAVSAAAFAVDRFSIVDKAGNIMIPKDPSNMKKYLSKKIEDAGTWLEELPHIPKDQLDKAIDVIIHPSQLSQYIGKAEEALEKLGVGAAEMLTLDPKELIRKTNERGLGNLLLDLKGLRLEHDEDSNEFKNYTQLMLAAKQIETDIKTGKPINKETIINTLNAAGEAIGINVFAQDGFIVYTRTVEQGNIPRVIGPKDMMVDPSLSESDQVDKARRLAAGDSVLSAIGRGVAVPLQDARMALHEILFEDAKNMDDVSKNLDKEFRSGGYMVVEGGKVILYKSVEGTFQRYLLGPWNLFKNLIKIPTGDFSYVEAGVDYGSGLFPVMILGLTSNFISGKFSNIYKGKFIWKSLAYPIKGALNWGDIGFRHIIPNLKSPKDIILHPGGKMKSQFLEAWNRWRVNKMKLKRIFTHEGKIEKIYLAELENLTKLYEGKKIMHESTYHKWSQDKYEKQADDILRQVEGMTPKGSREPEIFIKEIDLQIKQREELLLKIDKSANLAQAIDKLKNGNTKGAQSIWKKLGFSGEITLQNAQSQQNILRDEMIKLDSEVNINSAAKDKERQEAFGKMDENVPEPEAAKTLTDKEKTDLTQKLKDSKEEITKLSDEGEKAIREEMERATNEGKSLADPEVAAKIEEKKAEYNKKFADLFEAKGIKDITRLDDEVLREHGLDPVKVREEVPKLEAKVHAEGGRIKRVGKGLLGFAAGLLAIYGISKGIELFHSEEKGFDLEKLEANKTPEQKESAANAKKKMSEKPAEHKRVMEQIQYYFSTLESDYRPLNEILGNPMKLNETGDDDLKKIVDNTSKKHSENIEKTKKFLTVNREAILLYYEKLPQEKDSKDRSLGQFFSIGMDNTTPYLKYADESDFRSQFYEIIDMQKAHMDELLKGEKITGWDQATYAGKYVVPVYGTYMDGKDCYQAIGRGEWTTALKSGGWTILGGVSDVLMVAGFVTLGATAVAGGALKAVRYGSSAVKGAGKAARLATIVPKLEKIMEATKAAQSSSKLAKMGKYSHSAMMVGMGADIGRQIFTPPKSQTYTF